MRTNSCQSTSVERQEYYLRKPEPGEIWEVSRQVRSPLEFSIEEQKRLYSDVARNFLWGDSPQRYVIIINNSETEQEWQIVSVMIISEKTDFLNDIDLLITSKISGLEQDFLVETWHVVEMLNCNLLQPVGQRLSRNTYDLLLSVGDYYHGLIDEPPKISEIQRSGLKIGTQESSQKPEILKFHQQEKAWSDVLTVPVAAYRTYLKGIRLAEAICDEAMQVEQELEEIKQNNNIFLDALYPVVKNTKVLLSSWLQNVFDTDWQVCSEVSKLAIATRSFEPSNNETPTNPDEIAVLIEQLSSEQNEHQRRKIAKRLGEIATGNSEAIQALVNLLHTTQNDETLWTAVESLWRIDPGNPATGVRRVKIVDLGMQVAGEAVALAVALVQRAEERVSILLQVYPVGNESYLPPDLKLILLDESRNILSEVAARRADVYIQLKLNGQPGEQFSVQVALGEASIMEDFVI